MTVEELKQALDNIQTTDPISVARKREIERQILEIMRKEKK